MSDKGCGVTLSAMTDPNQGPEWSVPFRPAMNLIWYPNSCGWHVFLQQTGVTAMSRLKPTTLRRLCLGYREVPQYGAASEVLMHVANRIALEDLHEVPWPH